MRFPRFPGSVGSTGSLSLCNCPALVAWQYEPVDVFFGISEFSPYFFSVETRRDRHTMQVLAPGNRLRPCRLCAFWVDLRRKDGPTGFRAHSLILPSIIFFFRILHPAARRLPPPFPYSPQLAKPALLMRSLPAREFPWPAQAVTKKLAKHRPAQLVG